MVSGEAVWLQAGWLFQEVVSGEVWWCQESLGWFQENCVVSGKAAWFQERLRGFRRCRVVSGEAVGEIAKVLGWLRPSTDFVRSSMLATKVKPKGKPPFWGIP